MIDPVVVVDIDGTLGDYHSHFFKFAREYLGLEEIITQPFSGRGSFREWYKKATGIDDRTWHDIKLAYRQGAQKRSMPVFDEAADLTAAVRRAGAELWLCTTRPFMRLDNIDPDTRFWLDRHGIQYDGLIHDEYKYAKMATYVDKARVVAVLEDEGEQIEEARAQFGDAVILRYNNFNRLVTYAPHVYDLGTAKREILHNIDKWMEEYENGSTQAHQSGS